MTEYNPSKIIKDGNTYNFRDTTKIPLAGSNQISGSLIPSTNGTVNLGGSSYQWNNAYIKSLTINGVACGDILTHNASEFIPRSGGAVFSSTDFYRDSNDDGVTLGGGFGYLVGGTLVLAGPDIPEEYRGRVALHPSLYGNIQSMQIYPSGTWTWSGTAVQLVSDQRLKQQISQIDDALLDAWEDVIPVQFKYNDAVEEKLDNARLHTGYVVQQIDETCKKHNVDVSKYGLFCHEEYQERTEEVTIENEDGTTKKETKVIEPAREYYSLRYTEALIVECAYLRKCIKELRTEIEELKSSK